MGGGNALAQNRRFSLPCKKFPDKGHAIKGLVDSNGWDLEPFGPAKRSGPSLLSLVGYKSMKAYLKSPLDFKP